MCFPEGRFTDLWEDELKTARLIGRPRLRFRLHGFALLVRLCKNNTHAGAWGAGVIFLTCAQLLFFVV